MVAPLLGAVFVLFPQYSGRPRGLSRCCMKALEEGRVLCWGCGFWSHQNLFFWFGGTSAD